MSEQYHKTIPMGSDTYDAYLLWREKIPLVLKLAGVWDEVAPTEEGERLKKEDEMDMDDKAKRKNNARILKEKTRAYGMILLSLPDSLISLFSTINDAEPHTLWKAVKAHFESNTLANKQHTRQRLINTKMDAGEKYDVYAGRIQALVRALRGMGETVSDSEVLTHILAGLPDSFAMVKSFVMMSNDATLASVNKLLREYQESEGFKAQAAKQEEESYFVAGRGGRSQHRAHSSHFPRGSSASSSSGSNAQTCYTCNQPGHRSYECDMNRNKPKCTYCRGLNHTENECRRKRNGQPGRGQPNSNSNARPQFASSNNGGRQGNSAAYVEEEEELDHFLVTSGDDSKILSDVAETVIEQPAMQSGRNYALAAKAGLAKPRAASAVPSTSSVLDSGASGHVINNKDLFVTMKQIPPVHLRVANNEKMELNQAGTAQLTTADGKKILVDNALFAPGVACNLLSVSAIADKGHTVLFDKTGAVVRKESNNEIVMQIPRVGNLYVTHPARNDNAKSALSVEAEQDAGEQQPIVAAKKKNEPDIRLKELFVLKHHRHGHLCLKELLSLARSGAVKGLEELSKYKGDIGEIDCKGCVMGKAHRRAFKKSNRHHMADVILDRAHSDLCGPIRTKSGGPIDSSGGGSYLLTIIDERSRKTYGFVIKNKSDATRKIIEWCKQTKVETGRTLKEFHSDGGTEFVNKELQGYFTNQGTRFTTTTKSTPQHNGIAERMNRTLFEMARAMLCHASLPLWFWPFAADTAIHIRNRCPTAANPGTVPEAVWRSQTRELTTLSGDAPLPDITPSVKHFKVFGCNAFVHVQDHERKKLDPKAKPGIFVGYSEEKNAFRIYIVATGKVEISRDVRFMEDNFSFAQALSNKSASPSPVSQPAAIDVYSDFTYGDDIDGSKIASETGDSVAQQQQPAPVSAESDTVMEEKAEAEEEQEEQKEQGAAQPRPQYARKKEEWNSNISQRFILTTPRRAKDQPDPPPAAPEKINSRQARVDRREQRSALLTVPEAVQELMVCMLQEEEWEGEEQACFTHSTSSRPPSVKSVEPKTYQEAISGPDARKWKQAMEAELHALDENNVFEYVYLPDGANLMKCKWHYKIKYGLSGEVDKLKARLVGKGFTQVEGIDYRETFAPVMKYKSLRILLVIAAHLDYEIKHLDVPTAFLNAALDEDVYMEQPQGYHNGVQGQVCKLLKSLYGIKQGPHNWNGDLNAFLLTLSFMRCLTDTCIYAKTSRTGRVMVVAVFVDDLIPMYHADDTAEWQQLQASLFLKYKIKDLGDAQWVLGMRLTRDRRRKLLTLDQESYTNKMLDQFQMTECHAAATPSGTYKLTKQDSPSTIEEEREVDRKLYESMVGSLLYASISTRPDITHAVNAVSRFLQAPGQQHVVACKRVLRYIRGTAATGLVYDAAAHCDGFSIDAYSDSDWCGDLDDRRSTSGYLIKINGCTVSWASKKQTTVALSSCEAEYYAISATIQETTWIQQFLQELFAHDTALTQLPVPTRVLVDNQSAIHISKNDIHHNRTKHIDVRHHFIREAVKTKLVELVWVPSQEQLADILTKSLGCILFQRLCKLIMASSA